MLDASFQREWERFSEAVPQHLRNIPLVDAYAIMLADPNETVRDRAAQAWCKWEDAHVSLTPGHQPNPLFDDRNFDYDLPGWSLTIGATPHFLRRIN
jgi:proline iminopeptidase